MFLLSFYLSIKIEKEEEREQERGWGGGQQNIKAKWVKTML